MSYNREYQMTKERREATTTPIPALNNLVEGRGAVERYSDDVIQQQASGDAKKIKRGRKTRQNAGGEKTMEISGDSLKFQWQKKMNAFAQLWQEGLLCDVILRAQTSEESDTKKYTEEKPTSADNEIREYKEDSTSLCTSEGYNVHAVVVAACSPYLKALLCTEVGQPPLKSKSSGLNIVTLKGISPDALEPLIKYMYTEKLDLDSDVVMAVLAGADILQLDGAKFFCCEWLEQHVDASNAFMISSAAERYHCFGLIKTVQQFIDLNFSDIVNDPSFLLIKETVLQELLIRDQIRVLAESEVIEALVKWTNYEENRLEAFGRILDSGAVRLSLLTGTELNQFNITTMVQSSRQAMRAVGREACSRLSGSLRVFQHRRWMPVAPRHCAHQMQSHRHAVYALMEFQLKLVSGSADNTIKIWDPLTWECEKTLTGHTDEVATLGSCAGMLISGSGDRTIKVWDPKSWVCAHTLEGHEDEVCALTVCQNRLVSASADFTVRIWIPGRWECERIVGSHMDVAVALTVCADKLISGSEDGTIKVWEADGWSCVRTIHAHTSALATLTCCNGKVVSGSADSTIKVWDPHTWACERTLEGHADQVCVLVEAGSKLISASGDANIKIWSTDNWTCDRTLEAHDHPVVALCTCSGRLVSGSGDGIKVWE